MKKAKVTKSNNPNDCTGCCYALACIEPCNLPKGYHYEYKERD